MKVIIRTYVTFLIIYYRPTVIKIFSKFLLPMLNHFATVFYGT